MNKLSQQQERKLAVFGIAGNFAEHLSQAGEDADFVNVKTAEKNAPKGIFPIYLPGHSSFIGTFPLSHSEIRADFSERINLQMEPEMCVLFDVEYQAGQVAAIQPTDFSAFNDCSIRRPNAKKISQKKNWGQSCTGIAENWIAIDQFQAGGLLDHIHIASFLRREGDVVAYGVDSPVIGYQYFYEKLLSWIIQTLNTQQDFGPLENLSVYLSELQYPKQIIISLGATRYTSFGETGFLQPEDEVGVFVYDDRKMTEVAVTHFFSSEKLVMNFSAGVALIQTVLQK